MDMHIIKIKRNIKFCLELTVASLFGGCLLLILKNIFSSTHSAILSISGHILLVIALFAFIVLLILAIELCTLRRSTLRSSRNMFESNNFIEIPAPQVNKDLTTVPLINSIYNGKILNKFPEIQCSISEAIHRTTLQTQTVLTEENEFSNPLQNFHDFNISKSILSDVKNETTDDCSSCSSYKSLYQQNIFVENIEKSVATSTKSDGNKIGNQNSNLEMNSSTKIINILSSLANPTLSNMNQQAFTCKNTKRIFRSKSCPYFRQTSRDSIKSHLLDFPPA